jgi:sedoheptulokinase
MNGMAEELYRMYETINEGTGITADHLIASGNGLRMNPRLQQIFSSRFNADLTMSRYKEEAACGAAVSSYTEIPD